MRKPSSRRGTQEMVIVTSILGFDYYFRCTADGRIQQSSDGKKWIVAKHFRGRRADMRRQTVHQVEEKIATQMALSDSNYDAIVVPKSSF